MNRKMIRRFVGKYVYEKGVEIRRTGGVFEYRATPHLYEDGVDVIHAVVRGSGIKTYRVTLFYDFFKGEVISADCDCPVFEHSKELCPHCAAALLSYANETGAEDGEDDEDIEEMQAFEDDTVKELSAGERPRATSPVIATLIDKQSRRQMLPFTDRKSYRKVVLKPILTEYYGLFHLSFCIGITKMYVLKNLFEFADRLKSLSDYSYGKQLHFVHSLDSFEPGSGKLAKFLVRLADSKRENINAHHYESGYAYSSARSFMLSPAELEDFLLCVEGEFEAHITGSKKEIWHLEGTYLRRLSIQREGQGILLSAEKKEAVAGSKYLIYFQEGKIYLEEQRKLEPVLDFAEAMERIPDGRAYIGENDIPAFCRILLPRLKEVYEISYQDFDEAQYTVSAPKFEIYLDAPEKDRITCKIKAVYGESKYDVSVSRETARSHVGEKNVKRDMMAEGIVFAAVSEWFPICDEEEKRLAIEEDEDAMYSFLTDGIKALQTLGNVFISDTLKRYRVVAGSRIKVGVSVGGGLLELSFSAQDLTPDQVGEILSKYDRKKKYYRLKNGEFVNIEGTGAGDLSSVVRDLGLAESQIKKGEMSVPEYRLFYLEEKLSDEEAFDTQKDAYYKKLLADTENIMNRNFPIPASLQEIARDYQKTGFCWLMRITESGFGGILADDMGLGKTLQVIAVILYQYQNAEEGGNRRCLIVTPASLVYNWESEFERFAPGLPVTAVAGSAALRKEQIKGCKERDILVTSYDLLKRDIEYYESIPFFLEIIDEAQFIKNHTTQAARAVKTISAKSRLALTGTPVENRLSELWSIFDYLMPGFLYSYDRFRREIEIPAVQEGNGEVFERLKKIVRPFILRRLKGDVLKDLPEKMEENLYTRLGGSQKELYDAHVQRIKIMLKGQSKEEFNSSKIQILTELTRLRQICCDPALIYEGYEEGSAKCDMCMDLIQNAIEGGHKILLFSQFTSMLQRLAERLNENEIPFYTITGDTPKEERLKLVNAFNENGVPVFCISLKAGGTGLNLASADIVIHFDPWWNLAVQNQATDRAHRIGQKNVVTVYKLIARGTIEEKIVKLQEQKRELADRLLPGSDQNSGNFSREELLELLA